MYLLNSSFAYDSCHVYGVFQNRSKIHAIFPGEMIKKWILLMIFLTNKKFKYEVDNICIFYAIYYFNCTNLYTFAIENKQKVGK